MARYYAAWLVLAMGYALQSHLGMDVVSDMPVLCNLRDSGTKLGDGFSSVVYRCSMDTQSGSIPVAVKVFDKARVKDLRREVDIYLTLKSRINNDEEFKTHFVQMYGVVSGDGRTYQSLSGELSTLDLTGMQWIVMEYCSGGEMFDVVSRHRIDFLTYLEYFGTILNSASLMHEHRILHKDFKLENVMLCKNHDLLVPKIIDFGFSLDLDTEDKSTLGKELKKPKGTFLTEFLECGGYLPRFDVFSIAVSLWSTALVSVHEPGRFDFHSLNRYISRGAWIPSKVCLRYLRHHDSHLRVYQVVRRDFGTQYDKLIHRLVRRLRRILFNAITPTPLGSEQVYTAANMAQDIEDLHSIYYQALVESHWKDSDLPRVQDLELKPAGGEPLSLEDSKDL